LTFCSQSLDWYQAPPTERDGGSPGWYLGLPWPIWGPLDLAINSERLSDSFCLASRVLGRSSETDFLHLVFEILFVCSSSHCKFRVDFLCKRFLSEVQGALLSRRDLPSTRGLRGCPRSLRPSGERSAARAGSGTKAPRPNGPNPTQGYNLTRLITTAQIYTQDSLPEPYLTRLALT